jgi:hypothetical protein
MTQCGSSALRKTVAIVIEPDDYSADVSALR